jgi:hypothetical protein
LNLFYDSQFFFMDQECFQSWKELMNRIMDQQHHIYFNEILTKFNSTQSIFMSAESEAISKSRLLKRMSFVVHSGKTNQYLNYFNVIVEKIVECLKTSNSNTVLYQILLAFRVLMMKISSDKMKSLWPTIMSLLIKILENSNQEHPTILFGICRFLDYATIVLPEEFQHYKWIFFSSSLDDKLDQSDFIPFLKHFKKEEFTIQEKKGRKPLEIPTIIKNIKQVNSFANELNSSERLNNLYKTRNMELDQLEMDRQFEIDFINLKFHELQKLIIQSTSSNPKEKSKINFNKTEDKEDKNWVKIDDI